MASLTRRFDSSICHIYCTNYFIGFIPGHLFWSEIKIVRTLLSYGTWYKVVMNILHNRFACLWRQDLSQNVTTKKNWKENLVTALFFFSFVCLSLRTFIRLNNKLSTYFPESFARSHQSLLTMSSPFISFTSLRVPGKQTVLFVGLSLLPEIKNHYKNTITQRNHAMFSRKGLWLK